MRPNNNHKKKKTGKTNTKGLNKMLQISYSTHSIHRREHRPRNVPIGLKQTLQQQHRRQHSPPRQRQKQMDTSTLQITG